MTVMACPQGCGTYFQSTEMFCPGCRRPTNATGVVSCTGEPEMPGVCLAWWGPEWHRMRCRKKPGHGGVHSTHDDCGAKTPAGLTCALADGHEGPHGHEGEEQG